MNKPEYIRDNMQVPNEILAQGLDESLYYVRVCKEVKRNPELQDFYDPEIDNRNGYYTTKQVSERTSYSTKWIQELCKREEINCEKTSGEGRWVISKDSIKDLQERR